MVKLITDLSQDIRDELSYIIRNLQDHQSQCILISITVDSPTYLTFFRNLPTYVINSSIRLVYVPKSENACIISPKLVVQRKNWLGMWPRVTKVKDGYSADQTLIAEFYAEVGHIAIERLLRTESFHKERLLLQALRSDSTIG